MRDMAHHWKDHLAEGHNPKIISDDIDEMSKQLEVMRAEIMRRLFGADAKHALCGKCGSDMIGDYCSDDTCPYSDWPQRVPLTELYEVPTAELRQKYEVLPRIRVYAEVHDDSHFDIRLASELDIELKPLATTDDSGQEKSE